MVRPSPAHSGSPYVCVVARLAASEASELDLSAHPGKECLAETVVPRTDVLDIRRDANHGATAAL
jgi:hypothetical protein